MYLSRKQKKNGQKSFLNLLNSSFDRAQDTFRMCARPLRNQ